MDKIIEIIDTINEWAGKLASILGYVLFLVVIAGVTMRKVFDSPLIWNFELSYMLYAVMFLLGLGYTLKHKMHVTIDVFYVKSNPRVQMILDIIGVVIFLIPFTFVALKSTLIFSIQSWQGLEHSQSTWGPPIYPFKSFMPIAFFLLFLQAVSELTKSIRNKIKKEI